MLVLVCKYGCDELAFPYGLISSSSSKDTRCIKKFEFEKGSRDRNKK